MDLDIQQQHLDADHIAGLQVDLPLEEFEEDLELRLGRANGNIHHRQPGIEGVHDGQVMVRLKKKRFIVIDYSIVPTEADVHFASLNPKISILKGAGKNKCATTECPKIGVPVLLYDSDPLEPASLYLRSGLCFTCQRNLNEKRRAQRKRGSDIAAESAVIFAEGPGAKKFKLNGKTIELHSDAIILSQPVDGVKSHKAGYSFQEIGNDLHLAMRSANIDVERLLNTVAGPRPSEVVDSAVPTAPMPDGIAADIHDSGVDEGIASVLGAAAMLPTISSITETAHSADGNEMAPPYGGEDLSELYINAFESLRKSMYLLTQWKQSWDGAIATAVANEHVEADPGLAEAVASAAAVAAAVGDQSSTNMVSLLLAADQTKDSDRDTDSIVLHEDVSLVPHSGSMDTYFKVSH